MNVARAPGKWLAVLGVLVLVALLRAERGVAELQGRAGEPSRLLRLAPSREGGWSISVLGVEGTIPSDIVILDRKGPLLADLVLPEPLELLQQFGDQIRQQAEHMKRALP